MMMGMDPSSLPLSGSGLGSALNQLTQLLQNILSGLTGSTGGLGV